MPTARSLTESRRSAVAAVTDLFPLISFRGASLRGKSRGFAWMGFGIIALLTLLSAWLPAYAPDPNRYRFDIILLLPSALMGVLTIAIVSAVSTGGGRELVPRDQAVAFPISPATDHLGALLMAPLNIAWLLQAWTLLGAVAYSSNASTLVNGASWRLVPAQLLVLLWLACATAIAQVVAWAVEWVRRGPYGVGIVRSLGVAAALAGALAVWSGEVTTIFDQSPTSRISIGVFQGIALQWLNWGAVVAVLLVLLVFAVAIGGWLATAVNRRAARDEVRLETSFHQPRPNPASDLVAILRTDRASVWRSLPLRRGLLVLSAMPGLVALAGSLEWGMLAILPGLVASGGALLFGVNAWALDARGALWRDSLPASAKLLFVARMWVIFEILLFSTSITIVLAALRAGEPTAAEVSALTCATIVVCFQVVSAAMRWSVRRPFSVDLRSARATPAPPLVMVGYSSRLALSTTLTGMVFIGAAQVAWELSVALLVPFVLLSSYRLVKVANEWAIPEVRSRVVATVGS
jgi:hypothetical protein